MLHSSHSLSDRFVSLAMQRCAPRRGTPPISPLIGVVILGQFRCYYSLNSSPNGGAVLGGANGGGGGGGRRAGRGIVMRPRAGGSSAGGGPSSSLRLTEGDHADDGAQAGQGDSSSGGGDVPTIRAAIPLPSHSHHHGRRLLLLHRPLRLLTAHCPRWYAYAQCVAASLAAVGVLFPSIVMLLRFVETAYQQRALALKLSSDVSESVVSAVDGTAAVATHSYHHHSLRAVASATSTSASLPSPLWSPQLRDEVMGGLGGGDSGSTGTPTAAAPPTRAQRLARHLHTRLHSILATALLDYPFAACLAVSCASPLLIQCGIQRAYRVLVWAHGRRAAKAKAKAAEEAAAAAMRKRKQHYQQQQQQQQQQAAAATKRRGRGGEEEGTQRAAERLAPMMTAVRPSTTTTMLHPASEPSPSLSPFTGQQRDSAAAQQREEEEGHQSPRPAATNLSPPPPITAVTPSPSPSPPTTDASPPPSSSPSPRSSSSSSSSCWRSIRARRLAAAGVVPTDKVAMAVLQQQQKQQQHDKNTVTGNIVRSPSAKEGMAEQPTKEATTTSGREARRRTSPTTSAGGSGDFEAARAVSLPLPQQQRPIIFIPSVVAGQKDSVRPSSALVMCGYYLGLGVGGGGIVERGGAVGTTHRAAPNSGGVNNSGSSSGDGAAAAAFLSPLAFPSAMVSLLIMIAWLAVVLYCVPVERKSSIALATGAVPTLQSPPPHAAGDDVLFVPPQLPLPISAAGGVSAAVPGSAVSTVKVFRQLVD